MAKRNDYNKFALVLLVLLVIVLVFLIIKPVINSLLGGVILAYLFQPLYKRILRMVKNKTSASLLTLSLITLIILVPLGYITNNLIKEGTELYNFSMAVNKANTTECTGSSSCNIAIWLEKVTSNAKLNSYFRGFFSQLSQESLKLTSRFFGSLPLIFLQWFVTLFSTFIFLKDGEVLLNKYKEYIPLREEYRKRFIKRFKDVSHGVIYGTVVVAVVQGFLATIGFFIFNVKAPIFWGVVVSIVSILPFIGPSIVYFPIAFFKIINGIALHNASGVFNGAGIAIWGVIVVSLSDNLIRYKITGVKSNVHPLLVLVGIIGGLQLFGVVGIFFGPLLLVFSLTLLEIARSK